MKTPLLAILALTAAILPGLSLAADQTEVDKARDEIWALEQSIYAGRQAGDLSNYINNTSPDYLAWPPTVDKPMGLGVLKQSAAPRPQSKERLTMQFMDFALHGDTAVIYYKTHRTQRFDGSASDDHFDTTHTWVRDGGKWRVFAGMARLTPGR